MDIASLIGFIMSFVMFFGALILGGSPLILFWDVPSLVLVLFGSFATTLATVDMSVVKNLLKITAKVWQKDKNNVQDIILQLVGFSEGARKDGLLSLDDSVKDIDDHFLSTGLRLMVDGTDPVIIKTIMELELEKIEERHTTGSNFFFTWSALGPAYGMLGTVMGLIGMMANLADTSSIGKGMALALITTFYGSILANMICLPIAAKLSERHAQEMIIKNIMLEGVLSIQGGENPRLLEQKLFSFLAPSERPEIKDFD